MRQLLALAKATTQALLDKIQFKKNLFVFQSKKKYKNKKNKSIDLPKGIQLESNENTIIEEDIKYMK